MAYYLQIVRKLSIIADEQNLYHLFIFNRAELHRGGSQNREFYGIQNEVLTFQTLLYIYLVSQTVLYIYSNILYAFSYILSISFLLLIQYLLVYGGGSLYNMASVRKGGKYWIIQATIEYQGLYITQVIILLGLLYYYIVYTILQYPG